MINRYFIKSIIIVLFIILYPFLYSITKGDVDVSYRYIGVFFILLLTLVNVSSKDWKSWLLWLLSLSGIVIIQFAITKGKDPLVSLYLLALFYCISSLIHIFKKKIWFIGSLLILSLTIIGQSTYLYNSIQSNYTIIYITTISIIYGITFIPSVYLFRKLQIRSFKENYFIVVITVATLVILYIIRYNQLFQNIDGYYYLRDIIGSYPAVALILFIYSWLGILAKKTEVIK